MTMNDQAAKTMDATDIAVLVVDDDPLARATLSQYFTHTPGFAVVAQAGNGVEALAVLQETRVDVVLSDINMPKMNGLTLLDEVKKLENPPVFVGITSLDQDDNMLQAIGRGGAGYLLKSQTPSSIVQSVRDALDGGMVVSPNAMRTLIKEIPGLGKQAGVSRTLLEEVTAPDYPLRDAEKTVLKLLCRGMSNAEIAAETRYSESAIKKRVSNLMQEFGAKSRLDLVVALLNKPEDLR